VYQIHTPIIPIIDDVIERKENQQTLTTTTTREEKGINCDDKKD